MDLVDEGPHHEGSRTVTPFLADWLEACLAETATRRDESREFLSHADTTRLERCLLDDLRSKHDSDQAAAFRLLALLPRLLEIGALRDLATAEQIGTNARLRALRLLAQHAPEHLPPAVIEVVARSPGEVASLDLVRLLAGREAEVTPAFIALLQDERWAARMRAVEFLAHAGNEAAREALRVRVFVETDAEIRSALQSALDAEPPL